MRSLRDLLSHARLRAASAASVNTSELEMLVAASVGLNPLMSSSALHARAEERISDAAFAQFDEWFAELIAGRPVQHLTGVQAFLDLELEVGPDVLIPRPETEFMVAEMLGDRPMSPHVRIAEIGLGSGAISLALLRAGYAEAALASEISPDAQRVARRNAWKTLGADFEKRLVIVPVLDPAHDPIEVLGNSLRELHAQWPRVSVLVSNPPYLDPSGSTDEIDSRVIAHEPRTALFVDSAIADPLWFYKKIAAGSPQILESKGQVWLEISDQRATETAALFSSAAWQVELLKDLTGRERVLRAVLKS